MAYGFKDQDLDIEDPRGKDRFGNPQIPYEMLSDWGKLAQGKTLGKKVNLAYTPGSTDRRNSLNVLEVKGDDLAALQLCLTLSPPMAVPITGAFPLDIQKVSGEADNANIDPLFAGFANAVVRVQWGTGGTNNQVEADYSNGLVLNLSGSYVRVDAFIDGNVIGETGKCVYVLAACLAPGYAKANNAQRTITANVLVPEVSGVSTIKPTPLYAKTVNLVGMIMGPASPPSPWSAGITFFRDAAGASAVSRDVFTSGSVGNGINRPVNVPNGGMFWRIDRLYVLGADETGTESAVFDLAI